MKVRVRSTEAFVFTISLNIWKQYIPKNIDNINNKDDIYIMEKLITSYSIPKHRNA